MDHQEEQKILLTNKNDFSENEDDTEVNNDGNDLPIFSECPISQNVSMFLCLLFMTCLKLTNVALEDLVLLLTANIPNYYKPKMSLYLLKKYFKEYLMNLNQLNIIFAQIVQWYYHQILPAIMWIAKQPGS